MEATTGRLHHPCPVGIAISVLGGKWKSVILYYLLVQGEQRFSALRRLIPGVTQRMLTLQLRELEEDGLVARTVFAQVPPRVEYRVTPFGESLREIIMAMFAWGRRYQADVLAKRPDDPVLRSYVENGAVNAVARAAKHADQVA